MLFSSTLRRMKSTQSDFIATSLLPQPPEPPPELTQVKLSNSSLLTPNITPSEGVDSIHTFLSNAEQLSQDLERENRRYPRLF